MQFDDSSKNGITELRYPIGEKLALDEISLKHDANQVYLKVTPICREYVISNLDAPHELVGAHGSRTTDAVLEKYSGLRWDSASASEVKSAFLDVFAPVVTDTDFWAARASRLLSLSFSISKEMAGREGIGLTAQAVRNIIPLESLVNFHLSRTLPQSLADELKAYLTDIPFYTEDDALNGSLPRKSYEQHGFLSMQLIQMISAWGEPTFTRDYRLRSTEIKYQAEAPISSVTAKVEDSVLIVSVRHVDTTPRNVEISS
ncbi:Uncharacterized protein AC499_0542 [Pseudomonas amygdali pv. lachrymans]|uniref:Uncharacterized protein n=1 Tax=Pseudomonas amygdali pv. lachrymans TaxID=53707 RepID=A0ABR5KRZ7_PSEAV|nr:Uncharacterized protein AC499_0542 [Pseudomonas amygdali pv. lachrymans]